MIVINNRFEIGQIVYLTTDKEQLPRLITGIKVCKEGELLYEIMQSTLQSLHYEFELSAEKNIELITS